MDRGDVIVMWMPQIYHLYLEAFVKFSDHGPIATIADEARFAHLLTTMIHHHAHVINLLARSVPTVCFARICLIPPPSVLGSQVMHGNGRLGLMRTKRGAGALQLAAISMANRPTVHLCPQIRDYMDQDELKDFLDHMIITRISRRVISSMNPMAEPYLPAPNPPPQFFTVGCQLEST
jgi:hypothetical protein